MSTVILPEDIFVQAEDRVADELRSVALFRGCPGSILTERNPEVELAIDKVVAKLTGLLIFISLSEGSVANADEPGPVTQASLGIEIIERVTINQSATGTRVPAKSAVQAVLQAIHLFQPPGTPFLFTCAKRAWELTRNPPFVSYRCNFETQIALACKVEMRF